MKLKFLEIFVHEIEDGCGVLEIVKRKSFIDTDREFFAENLLMGSEEMEGTQAAAISFLCFLPWLVGYQGGMNDARMDGNGLGYLNE